MNDDFSDIRIRQDRLEERMTHLEDRVEQEAGLRAAMDNELGTISATLKAHQKSLNALQEVQGDHTRRLTRIEEDVTVLKQDVTVLKQDVTVLKQDVTVLKQDVTVLKQDVTVLKQDVGTMKGDLVTVKTGVHAILDLLDANLGGSGSR